MQAIDNEFFEAYKRLDRLCSDIYGCRNGVSQYIEDMERQSSRGVCAVPDWDRNYKMLKHLRWVRNQIAHDSGLLTFSTAQDIQDVHAFHSAILAGQDPLTLLRKHNDRLRAAARSSVRHSSDHHVSPERNSSGASPFPGIFALCCILAALAIIVYVLRGLL
mgnify:CR=1 FL=1